MRASCIGAQVVTGQVDSCVHDAYSSFGHQVMLVQQVPCCQQAKKYYVQIKLPVYHTLFQWLLVHNYYFSLGWVSSNHYGRGGAPPHPTGTAHKLQIGGSLDFRTAGLLWHHADIMNDWGNPCASDQ